MIPLLLVRPIVLLLALAAAACGGNPAGPSSAADAAFPPALSPVMSALDADQWRHPLLNARMGDWVRAAVARVDVVSMADDVGARSIISQRRVEWNPSQSTQGVAWQASLLLHEARHLERRSFHSCGTDPLAGDRTMEEGGAYAVQILYLEHAGATAEAAWLRANFIGCR